MNRYAVTVGTPGGAFDLCTEDDAAKALRVRDLARGDTRSRRVVFVTDTDAVDPPQSGEIDWCENCGLVPVFASAGTCPDECTQQEVSDS